MKEIQLKRIRFSNGTQVPLLFVNGIPEYFFLKYIVINKKRYSYKTRYNYCRYYQEFYEYFINILKLNLTEIFFERNNFYLVVNNLTGFTQWLHSKINSKQNYNIAISSIDSFLTWYVYLHGIDLKHKSKFKPLLNQQKFLVKKAVVYKSITKDEVQKILKIITPLKIENPFKLYNQLRNYLMFLILIETGIRLSELLLLKINDFIRDGDDFYIAINQEEGCEDKRIDKPSYKNVFSERVVGISSNTYVLFEDYIKYSQFKQGVNSYVFKSNQRKPLSKSSVNYIIKTISKVSKVDFSCHTLRHYFAETMLAFLIEECNIDMERAKDELRTICGWSLNSEMPSYYTRKYLSTLANSANIKRLNNIYV
ncbi:tyrosine-type recombinase/integrase [Tenacibaculum mesophilum]|uniref:tyrosine-type recombinase/integrase n=1 Tax=Tenacibaculum mesophilum TaxID=104268 RepID=UPI00064B5E4A|nr:site-specific integrase [Tenacibaculum mesophilum]